MLGMKLRNVHNEIILDVCIVQKEWEKPLRTREMGELALRERERGFGGGKSRSRSKWVDEIEGWDGPSMAF